MIWNLEYANSTVKSPKYIYSFKDRISHDAKTHEAIRCAGFFFNRTNQYKQYNFNYGTCPVTGKLLAFPDHTC